MRQYQRSGYDLRSLWPNTSTMIDDKPDRYRNVLGREDTNRLLFAILIDLKMVPCKPASSLRKKARDFSEIRNPCYAEMKTGMFHYVWDST